MKLIIYNIIAMFFLFQTLLNAQHLLTPLEESNYTKLTSYDELISFLENAVKLNSKLSMDYIAKSVESRKIPAIKISKTKGLFFIKLPLQP